MLLGLVCKVSDGTFFSSLFSWSSFVLLFPSEMEGVFLWFYPLSFYHSRKRTDNWDVEHHFWLIWWMRINLLHSQVENESFLLGELSLSHQDDTCILWITDLCHVHIFHFVFLFIRTWFDMKIFGTNGGRICRLFGELLLLQITVKVFLEVCSRGKHFSA